MSNEGSYSLGAKVDDDADGAVQLHCQTPGGQNTQDVKAQFGVGVGMGVTTGEGQEMGVGQGEEQAALTMPVTRRVNIERVFNTASKALW
jgi:hypothetical protein